MFELSVGSKIFLLGEYQVLHGGSAFLTVIDPRFQLFAKPGTGQLKGIPSQSPAEMYFKNEINFFNQWDFEFKDPHQGAGGFGASTAQFCLLYSFKENIDSLETDSQLDFDLQKLHKTYLSYADSKQGTSPSGADLLAQIQGGLVEVDVGAGKIQRNSWPFPQWQILFFATGHKQATHEHLKSLGKINLEPLKATYTKAMEAYKNHQEGAFVHYFREYRNELLQCGWESPATTHWLNSINILDGVIAAKGCGAMGADVIATLVSVVSSEECIKDIEKMGLKYVGSLENRTEGFDWIKKENFRNLEVTQNGVDHVNL